MTSDIVLPRGCSVDDWNRSIDDLLELVPTLWPEMPNLPPSAYAARHRIMPKPFAGPWSNERTPYLVEMMDDMGPQSPIQEEYALKGHQIGFTAASENILLYWMDYNPTYLLYVSSTDDALKKWMSERLEPAIDSVPGLREKFIAPASVARGGSRQTGDTTRSKQFIGGALDMASAQSPASLASQTKQLVIFDEIDRVPALLKTGEGSFLDVGKARTDSFGKRRKILGFSTPTTYESSLIWQKYLAGDQRKYLVPCPHCGRDQELVFSFGEMRHGLKGDFKAGEFQKAFYICEFCGEPIFDYHKPRMLSAGHWEPTARSCYPEYRSRHISTLYAPPGMTDWDGLYRKYQEAQATPDGMRTFTNLELGLPYQEAGSRPNLKTVISLRGGYHEGQIQQGALYLTMGCDVQRGSNTDTKLPPRIELEVLAHGAGYRSWSVCYKVFAGDLGDPYEGAWEAMYQWVCGNPTFLRADGMGFPVSMGLVDSGDAADGMDEIIARFCGRIVNLYPSKGFNYLKVQAREKGDIPGKQDFKRYRKAIMGGTGLPLFEISTNYFKDALYNRLEIKRQPVDPQRAGFCDFPTEYGDEYFAQLTAEEKLTSGENSGAYRKTRSRNESLDCRIYAMAAGEAYLDTLVEQKKNEARAAQWTRLDIDKIDHRFILRWLENLCAWRGVQP
jgi:phage terminase large subunit GpA-like protein